MKKSSKIILGLVSSIIILFVLLVSYILIEEMIKENKLPSEDKITWVTAEEIYNDFTNSKSTQQTAKEIKEKALEKYKNKILLVSGPVQDGFVDMYTKYGYIYLGKNDASKILCSLQKKMTWKEMNKLKKKKRLYVLAQIQHRHNTNEIICLRPAELKMPLFIHFRKIFGKKSK